MFELSRNKDPLQSWLLMSMGVNINSKRLFKILWSVQFFKISNIRIVYYSYVSYPALNINIIFNFESPIELLWYA